MTLKIVNTQAYELHVLHIKLSATEQDRDQLHKELSAAKVEIASLRGQLQRSSLAGGLKSRIAVKKISCVAGEVEDDQPSPQATVKTLPSFARPTKSSLSKAKTPDELSVANSTPRLPRQQPRFKHESTWSTNSPSEWYVYKDGRLVRTEHYMDDTEASRSKRKEATFERITNNNCDSGWDDEVDFRSTESTLVPPSPTREEESPKPSNEQKMIPFESTRRWLHNLEFSCRPHLLSDAVIRDLLELHALPLKTRLDDDQWPDNSPVKDFRIDANLQYKILQQGHDTAKQIIWGFLDRNYPSYRRAYFPCGWAEVRLGRTELANFVGEQEKHCDGWLGQNLWKFRQTWPEAVHYKLYDLIDLRNIVCHYSTRNAYSRIDLLKVDAWLKDVQKLAIQLYDEPRACEVRHLRDELRRAVRDTVADIEALESLSILPYAGYRWELNHEAMFRHVRIYLEPCKGCTVGMVNFPVEVPGSVIRAAQSWTRGVRRDPVRVQPETELVGQVGQLERKQEGKRPGLQRRSSYCCEGRVGDVVTGLPSSIYSKVRRASFGETQDSLYRLRLGGEWMSFGEEVESEPGSWASWKEGKAIGI